MCTCLFLGVLYMRVMHTFGLCIHLCSADYVCVYMLVKCIYLGFVYNCMQGIHFGFVYQCAVYTSMVCVHTSCAHLGIVYMCHV